MSAPDEQLHPGPEITVWAPVAHHVEIEWASPDADGATERMEPKGDGWWRWRAPAQPSDAGNYGAVATNPFGSTPSALAALTVVTSQSTNNSAIGVVGWGESLVWNGSEYVNAAPPTIPVGARIDRRGADACFQPLASEGSLA